MALQCTLYCKKSYVLLESKTIGVRTKRPNDQTFKIFNDSTLSIISDKSVDAYAHEDLTPFWYKS